MERKPDDFVFNNSTYTADDRAVVSAAANRGLMSVAVSKSGSEKTGVSFGLYACGLVVRVGIACFQLMRVSVSVFVVI